MCKCSREMGFRIGRVKVHYEFTICVSVPGRDGLQYWKG